MGGSGKPGEVTDAVIELVDGEKLVSMFEKLQLGVRPKTVYEIDDNFFADYR